MRHIRPVAIAALVLAFSGAAYPGNPEVRRTRLRVPVWCPAETALTATGLTAKVDGSDVKVLRVRGPADDLVLLLVLDLTGDLTRIQLAREALLDELKEFPPNGHVALLRTQDGLQVVQDPTNDREALASAMSLITPSGKPGLLEAVQPSLTIADSILDKASVRAAVLFITDSNIYNYREDYTNPVINSSDSRDLSRRFPEGLIRERTAQLSAEAGRSGAPLFIVHLDYRRDRLNEAYQIGLSEVAQSTGGEARFCRSAGEIAPSIAAIVRSIREHYRVDIALPDTSSRSVQVQLGSGGESLQYRQRYTLR
jgi:hypothetical protein